MGSQILMILINVPLSFFFTSTLLYACNISVANGTVYNGSTTSPPDANIFPYLWPVRGGIIDHNIVPTNLVAVAEVGQISLKWNGVPYADSYNIYWSTSSDEPDKIKETGTKITDITIATYTHQFLSAFTRYYYVVTAMVDGMESRESKKVSAVPKSGFGEF